MRQLIMLTFSFSTLIFGEGFVAGTLVKTPTGYVPIEQLKVSDIVMCYDNNWQLSQQKVTHISKKIAQKYSSIAFDDEFLSLAPDQKLYIPERNCWLSACDTYCAQEIDEQIIVISLTVEKYHNYLVSKHDIIAHNIAPAIAIGLTWAFEGLAFEFVGATITAVFAGIGITCGLAVQEDSPSFVHVQFSYAGPGNPGSPEDPCKYDDAPYHHLNSRGPKSPAPKNGQDALNNSIPMKDTSPQRIGVSEGQYVVLKRTSLNPKCIYHGYTTTWEKLSQQLRNELQKSGLADAKGRPLR